jgi:hypothetical protein
MRGTRLLLGLFVDDVALALAVLLIVAAAALLIAIGINPLGAGAVLLCGSLTALIVASLAAARGGATE